MSDEMTSADDVKARAVEVLYRNRYLLADGLADALAAAGLLADPDAGDCDRCDDSPTGKPKGWVAGWVAAMRFAHHAHAPEPGEGFMSANGVLGAGPDAVIVDGDWLNANLADPDALAGAKADAWDEGWVAGCNDQQYGNEDAKPWTPNPYPADRIDPTEGTRG